MKTIFGAIAGLLTGFIGAVLMAPRSGRETRNSINKTARKQWKDIRMAYNESAHKLGLISARKKANLNRETVNAFNKNNTKTSADPYTRDNETLEKVHEKSAATKAVDSPSAKSQLRKVPIKTNN